MNRSKTLTKLAAALSLMVARAGPVDAQMAVTAATEEPAVELSPFQVNTSKDRGFVAASALAGGRLATELRDTPVAYSVITRDFIEALELDDLQTAATWAPNTTDMSDDGSNTFFTFSTVYQSRGLKAGTQQRNFFPQSGDNDTFDIERFDFGRGPNSTLFGNGTLGGTSSSTTKRARVDQAFQSLELRAGSWNNYRGIVDVNQPIGKEKQAAVRVVGLSADGDGWRDKMFDQRKGAFGTATYRPFRNTEIRLDGEYLEIKKQTAMSKLNERLAGWNGALTYDTPVALKTASAAVLNSATAAGVSRRPAAYFVWDPYNRLNAVVNFEGEPMTRGGGETATTPIAGFTYGASGGTSFNSSATPFGHVFDVPDHRFDAAVAHSKFFIPSDEFTISPDGPLLSSRFKDLQLTITQRFGDFFFEAAGDLNRQSYFVNGEENRGTSDTYIDINRVLIDGSPNPHFLEPYGDAQFFRNYRHYDNENYRFAAAYLKDTRFGSFGVNTMAGMNKNNYDTTSHYLSMATGADRSQWTRTVQFLRLRRYWSESSRPIADLSLKPIAYIDPSAGSSQIQPQWVADSRTNINSINESKYKYALAALNAKFFKDRWILLAAVRHDQYTISSLEQLAQADWPADLADPSRPLFKPLAPAEWATLTYTPKDPNGRPTGPATLAATRPRASSGAPLPQYANDRFQNDYTSPPVEGSTNTKSIGTVLHLTRWLSPFVNYAETFNPQTAYYVTIDGGIVPPTVAKGTDYGVRLELLDRRLDVAMTYYTNDEKNDRGTVSGGTPLINPLYLATPQGSTQQMNLRGQNPIPTGYQDLSRRHAVGYEIEAVANLTRGFRLTASFAQPKVYFDDANSMTRAYIDSHGEVFKQIAQDASVTIDPATNIASVNTAIPANVRSPDAQVTADAYNDIYRKRASYVEDRVLNDNQKLFRLFADYTVQSGRLQNLRMGLGIRYNGRYVLGDRSADTMVNPANPKTAIDDPTRTVYTLVYSPYGIMNVVGSLGYSFKLGDRRVTANLVVDNLLNQRRVKYLGTQLRPRDADYNSPAREAVPNGFSYVQPISFKLSLRMRL